MQRTKDLPVGAFYLNNNTREPDFCLSITDARKMRKAGKAWPINHGNDIRLQAEELTPEIGEIIEKSQWIYRPSGLPSIGYVNVLQLV